MLYDPSKKSDLLVDFDFIFLFCFKIIFSKKTRVLVTHSVQFLPRCDRVILLAKGKIVDQGTYEDIFENNPEFHAILKVS